MSRARRTHCVQVEIKDIYNQALTLFSAKREDGTLPLVLIPPPRSQIFPTFIKVPAGCHCLLQRFGKHVGAASQGVKFYPPFWRVAYVVTQQSCNYNAPVNMCPTSDNVMVSVDMMVVFRVSDPEVFVYELGTEVFDTAMSGCLEEAVRHLVRSQDSGSVWKLRGSRASEMLALLNTKFKDFGIAVSDCKITDVILPQELAASLEHTTKMEKSMAKIAKQQDFELMKIQQTSEIEVDEARKKGEQALVAENGALKRCLIDREQRVVKADQEIEVAMINAQQESGVANATAQASLNRKKTELDKMQVEQISAAEARCNGIRVSADVQAFQITSEAESGFKAARYTAEALDADASAEREGAQMLMSKREVELQLAELKVLQQIAATAEYNLVGQAGDKLVGGILGGLRLQNSLSTPAAYSGGSAWCCAADSQAASVTEIRVGIADDNVVIN